MIKKNISQRDIAKMLDVNVSTVSRALKGLPGVSPALRQEIVRLAENKGYRPNPFAVSLRYDTTHTIGVIVPDLSFSHLPTWLKVSKQRPERMAICVSLPILVKQSRVKWPV